MEMKLTKEDIDRLLDAVKAWRTADSSGHMVGMMLGAILAPNKEEKTKFMEEEKAKIKAMESQQRLRDDQATVLSAKLISIRDSMTADRVVNEAALATA